MHQYFEQGQNQYFQGLEINFLFRLNYYLVETDDDGARITEAYEEAVKDKKPVVILVGDEYHGFNR